MRKQIVLDKRTNDLLEKLASTRGESESRVMRYALQVYSDAEARLDLIEADPAFQAMMKGSARDIREGRVVSHEEVLRRSRFKSKPRKRD